MAFVLDTEHLPAILTARPMSDQDFADLCSEHPDLNFETSAEGDLLVMAPTRPATGFRNSYLIFSVFQWARADGRGLTCDSSTIFVLPNGARRSPDVSWTLRSRVDALNLRSFEDSWRLCPDFVLELKSPSDRLSVLRAKMLEYMENGAQLGWLIEPETRTVSVYHPNGQVEVHTNIDSLTAVGPIDGFTLDLAPVWKPF